MNTATDPMTSASKAKTRARRPRLAGRARACVLCALLGWAALQLGLTLTLDRWFPQFRDPFYYHKAHRLQTRVRTARERSLTVVMLGSSRTAFGLCGLRIEKQLGERLGQPVVVFNSGVFGSGPITELLYLKRMLHEGLRPNLLLLEVMPSCLAESPLGAAEASWLDPCRLNRQEMLLLEKYGISTREMRRDCAEGQAVPWYYHRFAILSCSVPNWLPLKDRMDFSRGADAGGFAPCLLEPKTALEHQHFLERMRSQFGGCFVDFRFSPAACRALDDTLSLCRRHDIPAALILMPEGKEYQQLYGGLTRSRIDGYLRSLSQAHGVPLLDARGWVDDDDFSDSHHLLPRGARVFTERLGREELPALLRGSHLAARAREGAHHR